MPTDKFLKTDLKIMHRNQEKLKLILRMETYQYKFKSCLIRANSIKVIC